jgi:hypothetical protein
VSPCYVTRTLPVSFNIALNDNLIATLVPTVCYVYITPVNYPFISTYTKILRFTFLFWPLYSCHCDEIGGKVMQTHYYFSENQKSGDVSQ